MFFAITLRYECFFTKFTFMWFDSSMYAPMIRQQSSITEDFIAFGTSVYFSIGLSFDFMLHFCMSFVLRLWCELIEISTEMYQLDRKEKGGTYFVMVISFTWAPHTAHLYGRSPVCIRRCNTSWWLYINAFVHCVHLYLGSIVWNFSCEF